MEGVHPGRAEVEGGRAFHQDQEGMVENDDDAGGVGDDDAAQEDLVEEKIRPCHDDIHLDDDSARTRHRHQDSS